MGKIKTVNSISGGKTSGYIAVHFPADYELFSLVCIDDKKCKPKDKSLVDYINNKFGDKYIKKYGEFIATAEDDKTLYVMRDLEQLIGRDIKWVRGMSFDDVIDTGTQTRLPSWARRYCTEKMKLAPIFQWWFENIGEKCNMRIGFRFDEYDRMERFFNNSSPCNFRIPVSCKTYGHKLQRHEDFNWRHCSFPLIKNAITKQHIDEFWKTKNIDFPAISNCVGCFHKRPETLAAMAELNPSKMKWFANQELKDMGTWLDSKMTYQSLIDNKKELAKEALYELTILKQSCDSGGCTD